MNILWTVVKSIGYDVQIRPKYQIAADIFYQYFDENHNRPEIFLVFVISETNSIFLMHKKRAMQWQICAQVAISHMPTADNAWWAVWCMHVTVHVVFTISCKKKNTFSLYRKRQRRFFITGVHRIDVDFLLDVFSKKFITKMAASRKLE